jgi:ABC-2 type transport system permease protein
MRKYIETAKVLFKAQLVYRFDILLSMIFTISKILLAHVLWGAIFEKQDMVSGFTYSSMLSYYIINSFITQLDQSAGTGGQIAAEIRSGRFSKYIVKPMSIFGYFTAQTAGVSAFLLSFNLLAALAWIFLFRVDFDITGEIVPILSALVLILLGLLFMMQMNYYIGILAFKFLDTSVFSMIKDNVVQFVTGSLIPLALLPAGIVDAMRLLPFYYVSYLPSMLLIGRNENETLTGMIVLVIWNAAFGLLNAATYKKLKMKYDGVGI